MNLERIRKLLTNGMNHGREKDEFLYEMRDLARYMGREISVDDLRTEALARGLRCPEPSLWANIMRGKEWRRIGMRRSSHPSNKGRMVGVYRHV
jgi:predicted transcriptional regulator